MGTERRRIQFNHARVVESKQLLNRYQQHQHQQQSHKHNVKTRQRLLQQTLKQPHQRSPQRPHHPMLLHNRQRPIAPLRLGKPLCHRNHRHDDRQWSSQPQNQHRLPKSLNALVQVWIGNSKIAIWMCVVLPVTKVGSARRVHRSPQQTPLAHRLVLGCARLTRSSNVL